MSRRPAFRKVDVDRAIAALKAAGCTIAGFEDLGNGRFRVLTTQGQVLTPAPEDETVDPELAQFRRGHGYS